MILVFLSIVAFGIGLWLWPVPSGIIKMISITMLVTSAALLAYAAFMRLFESTLVQTHREKIGLTYLGFVCLLFLIGAFRHSQLYLAERAIFSFVLLFLLIAVGAGLAFWGHQNVMTKSWKWTFLFPTLWFLVHLFTLPLITKFTTKQGQLRPSVSPPHEQR